MAARPLTAREVYAEPAYAPGPPVAVPRSPGLARIVANRLRNGWGRVRPVARPHYVAGVPRTGSGHPLDPFFPPNIETLASAASSSDASGFVIDLLDRLSPCDETARQRVYYLWGMERFGAHWRNADITTVLWAAATLVRPASYLEIGVRRGRSAAVVAAVRPECAIYGFDLWLEGYGGHDNPGADFVRGELRALGHRGRLELVSGNSRQTLPAFLEREPDLYFDLITVDGDHSVTGAAADLANVLPRLKIGGIVVCDDVCVPTVKRVWETVVKRDSRYMSWEFSGTGYGVGAAIRITDGEALAARRLA
jgi:predicted O-methyltransferase YrrM